MNKKQKEGVVHKTGKIYLVGFPFTSSKKETVFIVKNKKAYQPAAIYSSSF
jgi:hypothetical protein